MPQAVDEGHGATLGLGTSTWEANAKIISITPGEVAREALPTSDLSTSANMTFIPADLQDNGEVSIEFYHNDSIAPPFAAAETITITYPVGVGQATAPIASFSGFFTGYTPGQAVSGEVRRGSGRIKITGAVTYTAAT
jgi:hypothetical protein